MGAVELTLGVLRLYRRAEFSSHSFDDKACDSFLLGFFSFRLDDGDGNDHNEQQSDEN